MTVLIVPAQDPMPWPTLGPLVCGWIEACLVYGPGDLRGRPVRLSQEQRAFIWEWYEVYPQDTPLAGRRRFERVALSLSKGQGKTELAAWIAAAELHHASPVRFAGWDAHGWPAGQPVRDPYIPMIAYTEEQVERLAYGALKAILEDSPIARDFDIGLERITRRDGTGRAEALSSSPRASDGDRTTFVHFDETHHFVMQRLKQAHTIMLANLSKRQIADGWSLETTTAPEPGAGSIAEGTMDYARAIAEGRAKGVTNFWFFHRQADDKLDITTEDGARAALLEAYGPNAPWGGMEAKLNLWRDPQYSMEDWQRYFCNRLVRAAPKAFDLDRWNALAKPGHTIPDKALVTLGFDGAMFHDSTGIVATEVETGFQQLVGVWEQPYGPAGKGWEVPAELVDDAVTAAFQRWNVWRMYADPPYWEGWVSTWAGRYGKERVVEWRTNRPRQMAQALQAFQTAIVTGQLSHDGSEALARHIGNAYRQDLKIRNDQGLPLYYIRKERGDSPNKIDLAPAAVLSWEACLDALTSGAKAGPKLIGGKASWL